MNRNRRDLTRRFLPKFFLLPYGTLPNRRGPFRAHPGLPQPPRRGGVPPPPGRWITAGPMASQPPCRGRRPRRPENETKTPPVAAFSPFPTPRPAPGKFRGTRPGLAATRRGRRPRRPERSSAAHLAAFRQPLVGAGFHPRPAFVHRRRYGVAGAAGGLGRPQRGNPRRGFPL